MGCLSAAHEALAQEVRDFGIRSRSSNQALMRLTLRRLRRSKPPRASKPMRRFENRSSRRPARSISEIRRQRRWRFYRLSMPPSRRCASSSGPKECRSFKQPTRPASPNGRGGRFCRMLLKVYRDNRRLRCSGRFCTPDSSATGILRRAAVTKAIEERLNWTSGSPWSSGRSQNRPAVRDDCPPASRRPRTGSFTG